MKDLLSVADLSRDRLLSLFTLAADLKHGWKTGRRLAPLAGRSLALIFEKPSLRTRVTFEVGMAQLGGTAVYLAGKDIGLGTRESIADVARNLGRWVDELRNPHGYRRPVFQTLQSGGISRWRKITCRQPRRTFPLLAPRSGVVVAKEAIEGMFLDPSLELYTLSDLSRVWVLVDVYEADVGNNAAAVGQTALPLCRSAAPAPAGHSPERDDVWCMGWPGVGSVAARESPAR